MLGLLTVVILVLGALGQSEVEKIALEGYPVETHTVTTQDNYILELVRIPHGKNSKNISKGVVFLMHGLLCSFNSFTYLGSEYGIAYNLAAAGYDVWMGNSRGNSFSRRHVDLNPDDPDDELKYFNFSFEEVGLLDLPALIDYVLSKTHNQTLHFVGHAQGATAFCVLNSMKTEYQSKFASASLLSVNTYAIDFPNKIVKAFCGIIDYVYNLAVAHHFVEFKPTSIITKILAEILVKTSVPQEIIGGGAVKQVAHYCQVFRDSKFRRFNYGPGNILKYGSLVPPSYDLTKIQVNTTVYYSLGDATQSEKEVNLIVANMQNARAHKVARPDFTHVDYIKSPDVKGLVTNFIIESIRNS